MTTAQRRTERWQHTTQPHPGYYSKTSSLAQQTPHSSADISMGQPKPVVPAAFPRTVFDVLHGLSHPSIRAMQKNTYRQICLNGIRKQVGGWARTCKFCQEAKIQRHIRALVQTFNVPHRRFDHINVDIMGPPPSPQGYTYLLTIVDRLTRWPEAIPLKVTDRDVCTSINLPLDHPFRYTVGHDFL